MSVGNLTVNVQRDHELLHPVHRSYFKNHVQHICGHFFSGNRVQS